MRSRMASMFVVSIVAGALLVPAVSSGRIRLDVQIDGRVGLRGVATIESDADPLALPSYGSVVFTGLGSASDHVTAIRHDADGSVDITDEGVLIVASNPHDLQPQRCTGGLGTARCTYARFFHLAVGDGNDIVTAVGEETSINGGTGDDRLELRAAGYGSIECGAGYDRAFASAHVSVSNDCEEVTTIA